MTISNKIQILVLSATGALLTLNLVGWLASEVSGQERALTLPGNRAQRQTSTGELHEREFTSAKAHVQMDCQRDRTVLRINFTQPFNGILGVGNPGATKCKILGTSEKHYELQVLHNATDECGAKWDSATSSIANTLFIRFHQSLETGADIAKNVHCRLSVGDLIVGRRPTAQSKQKKQNDKIIKARRSQ